MTCLLLHEVFIKMKKLMHSFIHLVLFFYFELYLNSCSKEMFTFICVYYCRKKKKKKRMKTRKKKKFVQNIFYSEYSVIFLKLLFKKLLFRFGQGKWEREGVYCAKNIHVILYSMLLVTGIIQFVDMSILKALLKNFKK